MPTAVLATVLALSGALLVQGGALPVLRQAPARGELRPGQTVLVDDGSCPAGQIWRITGGSNAQGRRQAGDAQQPRASSCVPRP